MPNLTEINSPLLIMYAVEDKVVDPLGSRYIYDKVSSKNKQIICLEHSNHIIPLDYDRELVFEKIEKFFKQVYSPSLSGVLATGKKNTASLKERGLPY